MTESKSELLRWIRKLSYKEGDFTLSSGKKSHFYVDLKNTTLHPEGAYLVAQGFYDLVQKHDLHPDAVGGMTLGADPLATALSLVAREKRQTWPAFIVRKEPKGHGTGRYVEGIENLKAGSKVLVLEDVVTTGGSSVKAIERLREAGLQPIAVFSVVDRQAGGKEAFAALGVPYFFLVTLEEVQNAK